MEGDPSFRLVQMAKGIIQNFITTQSVCLWVNFLCSLNVTNAYVWEFDLFYLPAVSLVNTAVMLSFVWVSFNKCNTLRTCLEQRFFLKHLTKTLQTSDHLKLIMDNHASPHACLQKEALDSSLIYQQKQQPLTGNSM